MVGGSLGDRLGRKRVFSAGLLLFALASAGCGMAQTTGQLIAARAVQGVGAAMLLLGSLAIISAAFPKETRGRAIGTWSGITAIALPPVEFVSQTKTAFIIGSSMNPNNRGLALK